MQFKSVLFATCLLLSVFLLSGVFGCQPKATEKEPSTALLEITLPQLKDTVNTDSATTQKNRYATFINRLGKNNPISNFNVDSFAVPIKYFSYFDSLEQAGILFQNTDTSMWVMLTVDTLIQASKKIRKLNVCFIAKDNTGNLRYYDMTSDTTLANPVQLNPATANARMNTYSNYLKAILPKVDTSRFCLVSLRGSMIPYTDLQEIYERPKTSTTLYCVPVIKKCPNDATKLTVDFYLNIDLEGESVENQAAGVSAVAVKSTYFDFTRPCPSACPEL